MRVVQFFYTDDSEPCRNALRMLEDLVEQEDDLLLLAHDISTERGREAAERFDISTVPTTIVDGDRIIRGVPQSPAQILGE